MRHNPLSAATMNLYASLPESIQKLIYGFWAPLRQWLYGSCPGLRGRFNYMRVRVHFPLDSVIFRLACREHYYEEDNARLIAGLVEPESCYFDIGANIGLMAIPVLCQQPRCRVVSFEPSPNTAPSLRRTREGSAFRNRWEVVVKALGKETGTIPFYLSQPGEGAYDGTKDTGRVKVVSVTNVPMSTLDAEWIGLGRPPVSVIKCDVEGAELGVLEGAIECLKSQCPFVVTEWSGKNLGVYGCSPASLVEFCSSIQYSVYALPYMAKVETAAEIKLHMSRTESFLLAPR